MVEHLDCCLDDNLSGESMAMKSIWKINTKLQFLYRQNNSIIQPHFVYDSISWYPLINHKMRKKLLVNKCIHFCLKLNSSQHIGTKEFKEIN